MIEKLGSCGGNDKSREDFDEPLICNNLANDL
jgi:hypothetical protein